MKNIKSQKGAISLFALLSMLFFLAFMMGIYTMTTRRNAAQLEAVRETAKIYASTADANSVYDSMLAVTPGGIVPISTFEQLETLRRITEDNPDEQVNYTINGKLYTYKKYDPNIYVNKVNITYMLANDIILDMSTEFDNKEVDDIRIYEYMFFDKTKYNIESNNHNIYYKLPDGTLWKCIFYHDVGTVANKNTFSSKDEAKKSFAPRTPIKPIKYSILDGGIDSYAYPWTDSANYEFLLAYNVGGNFNIKNEKYQRWRQAINPTKAAGNTEVAGYEPIKNELGTSDNWGGLALSTSSNCYLDGSIANSDWSYSLGLVGGAWEGNGMLVSRTNYTTARACVLFVRYK